MTKHIPMLLAVASLFLAAAPAPAQTTNKTKGKLDVLRGPATAKLGAVAQVEVPAGYAFLDGKATRAMMKAVGEPTSGDEVGFLRPTNGEWSVYFEFSDVGYVKDDEKDKLDADKLLEQIKRGNDAANEQRKRSGNAPLVIVGWEQPPKYNPETHNLEWAIRATVEGENVLNYNTRLLGRKGVMEVILVCDPKDLAATLPTFRGVLADYKFISGETYAEYRQGDKLAKYGLAALITGGAAVGAAKLGLFAWLVPFLKKAWYLVVAAVVAVANVFKRIFRRLTGRDEEIRLED